jgi:Flp pilus assembly protein TadD
MRKSLLLSLALTTVVLVPAAAQSAQRSEAVKAAERAEKFLAKKKLDKAIAQAEAAVAGEPNNADHRMLLGRAYLENGRFRAAATSFADALALDSRRGGAALSLALTRIGLGDLDGARALLASHGELIAPADRGLALALTGDTATAVPMLEAAVRNGGADAKTRQNLALSYALAGRWPEAKLMASYDLDPATVSQRIMEWSRFAREGQAAAQVAALLGVKPGDDAGQPARLTLAPSVQTVQLAHASSPPPPVAMPEARAVEVAAASAPVETPAETDAPVVEEAKALFTPATQGVQFAGRSEVVQTIMPPRPQIAASPKPAAHFQRAAFVRPTGGDFVVQLGAFDSAAVAQDAWGRTVRRIGMLREFDPSTAVFVNGGRTFYRLSVTGFATRSAAAGMCQQLRARGGQCFVRQTAGDTPLQWARKSGGVRLAAR